MYLKLSTMPLRVQCGGKAPGILYICSDGSCVVGFEHRQVLTCDFALYKVWSESTQWFVVKYAKGNPLKYHPASLFMCNFLPRQVVDID